ncbi:glycine betaine ABC transporter substrate-binding protein [Natranaerobius thermophilus]|uniref:glycine betaine ABC transporter substrate-binding protein n=1 Tax=Natranaerobius thermophilus TaxID=375929 RepID=UPI002F42CFA3
MLVLGVTGCADSEAQDEVELTFADAGWESIRVHNYIAGIILEEGYGGYRQDIMSGSTPVTFTDLRGGGIDIYMEVWKENIQEEYNEALEKGEIQVLSINFDDNFQGLYVPTYVIEGDEDRGIDPIAPNLESVFDLPDYWEEFQDPEDPDKGRIIGAPSEWAVDEILEIKVETYGLDEHFAALSHIPHLIARCNGEYYFHSIRI